jgi:hypothetical protein
MFGMIQFLWVIAGAAIGGIFTAGIVYSRMQTNIDKARSDLNQLGKKYGRLTSMLSTSAWSDSKEKQDALARATEPHW